MSSADTSRPAGVEGSPLPGPYPVGSYAARLKARLREFAKVQVFGEVWNLGGSRAKLYFELRDERGALPCSIWRTDFERLGLAEGALADGARVVVAGGTDYYEGSRTSSPSFTFLAKSLRVAGEGDLLAQLDRLRKQLDAEGLFAPQKLLERPALPRSIGVVTGETGKARDDVLAGLARRGWQGRLVWAFAPVQDRRAAPAITAALQDLAASAEVETIVVARGGGSLADLFAFCDETLCRTVALLPVPVIASVGHHTDRTLIDDVAAVACSTPTHAAEQAVRVHCTEARADLARRGARLRDGGNRAVVQRARRLTELTRAPAEHVARERRRLHQKLRELRAAGARRTSDYRRDASTRLLVLERKAAAAAGPEAQRRRQDLERLRLALDAHDPERTLERGYALVTDRDDELVTSAEAARAAGRVSVRFRDDSVEATVDERRDRRARHPRRPGPQLRVRGRPDRGDHQAPGLGTAGLRETLDLVREGRELVVLLDWLAVDFMESGWDVKATIRKMVLSSTYRQSSVTSPELLERDPANRLLARGPRFRLPAEFIRDAALQVSGLLVPRVGGPSVNPYTPGDPWREVSHYGSTPATAQSFVQDHGEKLYRRSLYTFWKRTLPPPNMAAFDAPNREVCTVSRPSTDTPLQALVLLNDVQFVEAARAFAERILHQPGDDASRLRWAFAEASTPRAS